MVKDVYTAVGLSTSESTKMHVCIHKDNAGMLVLGHILPLQFTPASSHYAVKTHWFREKCIALGMVTKKYSLQKNLRTYAQNVCLLQLFDISGRN